MLAIEAGATRTTAGLYAPDGTLLAAAEAGPANPIACGEAQALRALARLARELTGATAPELVAAALAGAAGRHRQEALAAALCARLGCARAVVSTDLHPVLHTSVPRGPAVLALSGTGAAVLLRTSEGEYRKFGGRGPLMGDAGSGTHIAIAALRAAARAADGITPPTLLTDLLPEAAGVPDVEALAAWSATVPKSALARLAVAAARAAHAGDGAATHCILGQAEALAELTGAAFRAVGLPPTAPVVTNGGVFEHCALFAQRYGECLVEAGLAAPSPAPVRGHAAARALHCLPPETPWLAWSTRGAPGTDGVPATARVRETARPLDEMSAVELVRYSNAADSEAVAAVAAEADAVAGAVEAAAAALRAGGRIIYTGAGTSGRLGVLDAAECPPTFGVAPDRVIGIVAGGAAALTRSVEGAEDDTAGARADMEAVAPGAGDLVVGIAASGRTPYVLASLEFARAAGARTALLCCNPEIDAGTDIVIALDTGPEVLAGSTRLKAGTATKLVLNIISTGAMALSGRVYGPHMVGMRPVNAKLRRRAERMVSTLACVPLARAGEYLDGADGTIPVAVLMAKRGMNRAQAEAALCAAGGMLRRALHPE